MEDLMVGGIVLIGSTILSTPTSRWTNLYYRARLWSNPSIRKLMLHLINTYQYEFSIVHQPGQASVVSKNGGQLVELNSARMDLEEVLTRLSYVVITYSWRNS